VANALRAPLCAASAKFRAWKKVELDDPTNRPDRHYHTTIAVTINSSPSAPPLPSSSSTTKLSLKRAYITQEKYSLWRQSPKALASRQPHHSHCVFKLHLLSNTDTSLIHYHPRLVCHSEATLLLRFEFNNTLECPPQVQLPHRTHLWVLPSSLGEESLRQSPRLLGAESTRPP